MQFVVHLTHVTWFSRYCLAQVLYLFVVLLDECSQQFGWREICMYTSYSTVYPRFCAAHGDHSEQSIFPFFYSESVSLHGWVWSVPPVHFSPRHPNARSVDAAYHGERNPRWREFHGVTHQTPTAADISSGNKYEYLTSDYGVKGKLK